MQTVKIALLLQGGAIWTGGTEYTKNLIVATNEYCRKDNLGLEVLLIVGAEGCPQAIRDYIDGRSNIRVIPHPAPPRRKKFPFKQLNAMVYGDDHSPLTRMLNREQVDFVFPYPQATQSGKFDSATWIPDFQHKSLPEFFSKEELGMRDEQFLKMSLKAKTVVVSSKSVEKDMQKYFPDALANTKVLRFRISLPDTLFRSSPAETVEKYNLPAKFALVSNQFWAHKNHQRLLEAVAHAVESCPDVTLALTGRFSDYRDEGFTDSLLQLIHTLGISKNIKLLGLIPKLDQLQLMRATASVIQPSLCEGWSTVVEETRALGKRILISELAVHREQDVPGSRFMNPYSVGDITEKLITHWNEKHEPWDPEAERKNYSSYQLLFQQYGKEFYELAISNLK